MRHLYRHFLIPAFILLGALVLIPGCAHRREAFYPNDRGVQVQAPFVNVRVPAGPRVHVDATRSLIPRERRRTRGPSEPPLLIDEDSWPSSNP